MFPTSAGNKKIIYYKYTAIFMPIYKKKTVKNVKIQQLIFYCSITNSYIAFNTDINAGMWC